MKLSEMKPMQCGIITEIIGDKRFLSRVTSIGLTIGTQIEVMQNTRKQPVLVFAKDTMIAVNHAECEQIELREG